MKFLGTQLICGRARRSARAALKFIPQNHGCSSMSNGARGATRPTRFVRKMVFSGTDPFRGQSRFVTYGLGLLWFLVAICSTGCGKNVESEAGESDANGYFCRACQAKFYTERSLFAARCPGCRSTDLAPVVGFLCEKDGHTTLTPREGDSFKCERCESRLENIRLPHEKELRAWGAAKKNKAEVL